MRTLKKPAPSTTATTYTTIISLADHCFDDILLNDISMTLPLGALSAQGSGDLLDGAIFARSIAPLIELLAGLDENLKVNC